MIVRALDSCFCRGWTVTELARLFRSRLHMHFKWVNEQTKPVWKESVTMIILVLKYQIKELAPLLFIFYKYPRAFLFQAAFAQHVIRQNSRWAAVTVSMPLGRFVAFFKDWLGCFCNEPQIFLQLLKTKFAVHFFILPFPKAARDRLIQQCAVFTSAFNSMLLSR